MPNQEGIFVFFWAVGGAFWYSPTFFTFMGMGVQMTREPDQPRLPYLNYKGWVSSFLDLDRVEFVPKLSFLLLGQLDRFKNRITIQL